MGMNLWEIYACRPPHGIRRVAGFALRDAVACPRAQEAKASLHVARPTAFAASRVSPCGTLRVSSGSGG